MQAGRVEPGKGILQSGFPEHTVGCKHCYYTVITIMMVLFVEALSCQQCTCTVF